MLGPLAEVAPALLHPLQKKSIGDLWREVDQAAHPLVIEPLDLNKE
jgi:7,8-dihydro-6-hydroxymethylpterin-pyrophosphokinase